MNRISEKKVIEIEIAETDAHNIEPSEWLENHLMEHFRKTQQESEKCTCGGSWVMRGAWLEADGDGMHIYYNVRCENYIKWDDSCTEIGFADCSVVIDTTAY